MTSGCLKTWRCPECRMFEFYWQFDAPDGTPLLATLSAIPDMSSLEAAKEKALAEHEQTKPPPELPHIYTLSKAGCHYCGAPPNAHWPCPRETAKEV